MSLNRYAAHLVRVVDGDTLRLTIDLGFGVQLLDQPCRLIGIDAPEARGQGKEPGLASKNYLASYLRGRALIVQAKDFRLDSFRRWLIDVWMINPAGQQEHVGAHMVQAGHASRCRR